ncbi:MAG: shikimate dehydrogenase [Geodermatophilaceae bacterium]|nr:shikimate dehydrogenase [Geodermatophilaceae bacterium]
MPGGGSRLRVTHRAAVLGRPVAHSWSPALHRAAYDALGLADWHYDAVECDEERLPALLAGLDATWAGLSLTMPLKRAALLLSSSASVAARAVGAANTLVPGDGGWHAENTDVAGLRVALAEVGVTRVRRAVVLGAGGTARAALAALAKFGECTPTVLVREPSRTVDLMAAAERLGVRPILRRWPTVLDPDWDVLVSTVPAGAADRLASGPWPPGGVLLDVVYAPWPTALALAARAAGVPAVVGGGEVLLHQAAAQVELMTGLAAPLAAMRTALAQLLRR